MIGSVRLSLKLEPGFLENSVDLTEAAFQAERRISLHEFSVGKDLLKREETANGQQENLADVDRPAALL